MKIDVTYPRRTKIEARRDDLIGWAKGPFLFAAYLCPIVNLATGGKAWSVIVLWALYMVWTLGFSTDMVEYNLISQCIRLVTQSCILLLLIDLLLAPGWAAVVVPIVCFSSLFAVGILFLCDLPKQRHNMLPMLALSGAALIAAILGLLILDCPKWPLAVLGALSSALLVTCVCVLGGDMAREMKKMFHTE